MHCADPSGSRVVCLGQGFVIFCLATCCPPTHVPRRLLDGGVDLPAHHSGFLSGIGDILPPFAFPLFCLLCFPWFLLARFSSTKPTAVAAPTTCPTPETTQEAMPLVFFAFGLGSHFLYTYSLCCGNHPLRRFGDTWRPQTPDYAFSPLVFRASFISFGMIVTRLA